MARGIRTWRVIAANIVLQIAGGALMIAAVYFGGR